MSISTMEQKKLQRLHMILLASYFIITFIAPVLFTVIWTNNQPIEPEIVATGQPNAIKTILFPTVVIIAIITAGLKVLEKNIEKINVLKIDGTYNQPLLWIKNSLLFLSKALIPIALLIAAIILGDMLTEKIETIKVVSEQYIDQYIWFLETTVKYWVTFLCANLGFYTVGLGINKICVETVEVELDLRKKVSEKRAIEARVSVM